jgi:hypothetical protein
MAKIVLKKPEKIVLRQPEKIVLRQPRIAETTNIDEERNDITSGLESADRAQTIEDSVSTTGDLLTERQIEEREEVLTERGGSSSTTQVLGDEEDEELRIGRSSVLLGFDTDFISDGFYQSLSPRFGDLDLEARARSANSVLINRTRLYAGRKLVFDYTPISRFPKLNVAPLTREIIYSDLEKNKLYTILNKDKTNKTQAREAIESYLNLASQEEIEDSIITNRFESKKKIKLSSVSENLVTTNREAALPTVSEPTTTRTPVAPSDTTKRAPIQSSAQRSNRFQSTTKSGSGGGSSYR